MSEHIFLVKNTEQNERHTLLRNIDKDEAEQLIADGKAARIDLGAYDEFRCEAREAHDDFKAAERKIKESDDPRDQAPDVQAYELDKLREEYVKKSQDIQSEYETYIETAKEDARIRAARATITVTDADRATASQARDRYALKLATTGSKDTAQAIAEITEEVALLTPEQKTALMSDIPALLAGVGVAEVDKRKLIDEVQDTGNMDALAFSVASQMPHDVTSEYRTESLIRGWE